MAKGTGAKPKVSVTFGWKTFHEINRIAERDGASFAETVRWMCRLAIKHEAAQKEGDNA